MSEADATHDKTEIVLSEKLYFVCVLASFIFCFTVSSSFVDETLSLFIAFALCDIFGVILSLFICFVQTCLIKLLS